MTHLLFALLACTSRPPVTFTPAYTLTPPAPPDGFIREAGSIRGSAAGGRLAIQFDPEGDILLGGDLAVRTSSLGRAGGGQPIPPAPPTIGDCDGRSCVQLRTPGVTEWWLDRSDGFEQGWTIDTPPAGVGDLTVDLSIGGRTTVGGGEARIQSVKGRSWTLSLLHAWDADGVSLPSRFEATAGGLRIAINDLGARYPVFIDPVYSTPDYVVNGGTWIVAGGADVNGDGYVDLLMSSHLSAYGGAYLYFGSSQGFPQADSLSFTGLYDNNVMDYVPVAFAGDVNGDGYDDLMVSAPTQERVNVYAGAAVVSTEPTWTLLEFAGHSSGGGYLDPVVSVAGAGDVNADGYDDVIVGAPSFDGPAHATVYLGSATGPRVSDGQVLPGFGTSGSQDWFGYEVAGAGDVNGDGYADVVVSGWPNPVVYYGSAAGVSAASLTVIPTDGTGWSVAGAGDVDGDGYDDVIVGESDGPGKAVVFLGSAGGITTTAAWQHEGTHDPYHDQYGFAVAGAGDVNGDGYGDIVTGSEQIPDVFLGSATGLEADPVATLPGGVGSSVSGAGDVDQDGLDDVVLGTGAVYLAATFLDPTKADPDTDGDADSDTNADSGTDTDTDTAADSRVDSGTHSSSPGCGSEKSGCAAVPGGSFGTDVAALSLALTIARRRTRNDGGSIDTGKHVIFPPAP